MATAGQWLAGARPRTLPAAVAPVAVGTGAAAALDAGLDAGRSGRAVLALGVALALQVGVNYANDYSDGVRGTDDRRVGPFRLTGSGAAPARQVRLAAFASFGVAAVLGLALVVISRQWWLITVGAGCVAAAWYYTGGSRPYGYAGLGEAAVFVFFGLVAVLGTTYTQAGRVSWAALAGAVGVGSLACAILVANNLRDVPTDAESGKHTVAVRIGDPATRRLYTGLVVLALAGAVVLVPWHPWAALAAAAVPVAVRPVRAVAGGAAGSALIPVLRDTGRLALVYGLALGLGLALG
jgi:1,4-dihydroxy-2-naphthoate polyprenyltransferase